MNMTRFIANQTKKETNLSRKKKPNKSSFRRTVLRKKKENHQNKLLVNKKVKHP